MMKIVSTHPLPDWILAEAGAEVQLIVTGTGEELVAAAPDADALLGGFGGGDGERFRRVMAAARQVRWVHTSSAGVDPLLVPELLRSGAVLTCAKGEVVGSLLAEHAFALLLALSRGIVPSARRRHWDRGGPAAKGAYELRGLTLGIVGYGGTGQALARRAAAFDMEVVATRRSVPAGAPPEPLRALWEMERLDDLLAASDAVVVTLPLTDETRGLFDAGRFAAMKPAAVFINVGRGETVVTDALVGALREGPLGAAGLDVTDPEPLPDEHPLWRLENVLVTPHIAGNSPQRAARNYRLIADNLRRFIAGEPLVGAVDLEAGY